MMDEEWGHNDLYLAHSATTSSSARDALARRLRPRVQRLVASFLRNRADAEDAAQLALLEILRAAASFRGESSLETWSDKIAVRTAVRLARSRRLAAVRSDRSLDPDELPSGRHEPDVFDGLPRSLRAYLDALPETRRTALVLHHVLGYSVQEIAELTSTSANTVKDRLLSARGEVRKMVRRDVAMGAQVVASRRER